MPCVEQFHRSRLVLRITFVLVAMLLGWSSVTLADRDGDGDRDRHRGRDRHPEIQSVTTNYSDREFKIIGRHFGTRIRDIKVSLATFGRLTVKAVIDTTMIIAQFPDSPVTALAAVEEGLPPGDYVLTVEVDGDEDTYGLTIGAVGPQGPAGEKGTNGMNGAAGMAGMNGKDGSSCSISETVVSCTDGTSHDVQGPPGSSGSALPMVITRTGLGIANSANQKNGTAVCLENEIVVGGGYTLFAPNDPTDTVKNNLTVVTSQPNAETRQVNSWTVFAREITPTPDDSWGMNVFARCMASPVPELQ